MGSFLFLVVYILLTLLPYGIAFFPVLAKAILALGACIAGPLLFAISICAGMLWRSHLCNHGKSLCKMPGVLFLSLMTYMGSATALFALAAVLLNAHCSRRSWCYGMSFVCWALICEETELQWMRAPSFLLVAWHPFFPENEQRDNTTQTLQEIYSSLGFTEETFADLAREGHIAEDWRDILQDTNLRPELDEPTRCVEQIDVPPKGFDFERVFRLANVRVPSESATREPDSSPQICEHPMDDSPLRVIQHLMDFSSEALPAGFGGFIENESYTAAVTCDDGACALHALLGTPSADTKVLKTDKVRDIVLMRFNLQLDEFLADFGMPKNYMARCTHAH